MIGCVHDDGTVVIDECRTRGEPLILGGTGGSATSFDNFMNAEEAIAFGIVDEIKTFI